MTRDWRASDRLAPGRSWCQPECIGRKLGLSRWDSDPASGVGLGTRGVRRAARATGRAKSRCAGRGSHGHGAAAAASRGERPGPLRADDGSRSTSQAAVPATRTGPGVLRPVRVRSDAATPAWRHAGGRGQSGGHPGRPRPRSPGLDRRSVTHGVGPYGPVTVTVTTDLAAGAAVPVTVARQAGRPLRPLAGLSWARRAGESSSITSLNAAMGLEPPVT